MFRKLPILTLLAALSLTLLLGGCVAGRQRGVAGETYVSSTRPAIQVAVEGLPLITGGTGRGSISQESANSPLDIDVWTNVYGTDASSPMALVAHAELPDSWIWTTVYPRKGGIHLKENESFDGRPFTAFTYLVPAVKDPLVAMMGDPTEEGAPRWIARQFVSIRNHRMAKIILEYREPVPAALLEEGLPPEGTTAEIAAFEARAKKAFIVGVPAEGITVTRQYPKGVSWRFMNDTFLGDVMRQDTGPLGF